MDEVCLLSQGKISQFLAERRLLGCVFLFVRVGLEIYQEQ